MEQQVGKAIGAAIAAQELRQGSSGSNAAAGVADGQLRRVGIDVGSTSESMTIQRHLSEQRRLGSKRWGDVFSDENRTLGMM